MERPALTNDLLALRRHFWFIVVAIALAIAAGAASGLVSKSTSEAAFRERVTFRALPPLFGPPTLPSNEDAARFAASQDMLDRVSQALGQRNIIRPPEKLADRLRAQPVAPDRIDFAVSESDRQVALIIAKTWRDTFDIAIKEGAPDLTRTAATDYQIQLAMAQNVLSEKRAAAAAQPADASLQAAVKAAEENLQVASRLVQSYEVVARTIRADVTTIREPHIRGFTPFDWAGRFGAAAALGLVVGVLGALALDALSRRQTAERVPVVPD